MFEGLSAKALVIAAVRTYQRWAPPRLRESCRFEPTCSNYAILAIDKYGVVKGLFATMGRLARCRPPHGGNDFP
jgi:putative membrane protein insertion efficiency factor